MADLATIATAIKKEIDAAAVAGTFNRVFQARLLWANRQQRLEDANVLCVDVAGINSSRSLFSRGRHLLTLRYHVAVRKRFEATEEQNGDIVNSEVSDLVILLDSLWKFFMPKQPSENGRKLADYPDATVLGPQSDSNVDTVILWEDLETLRQFSGYFELTIQVVE